MDKVLIVFWSSTGNTEAMAEAIQKGLTEKGVSADLAQAENTTSETILQYDKIAFGCPAMGSEVLEEDTFEPLFSSVEQNLSGKKIALFGSYGWGDGEWMRDWADRTRTANAKLFGEGFIQNEVPDEAECTAFGQDFADF